MWLKRNGGPVETRTLDLYRVKVALWGVVGVSLRLTIFFSKAQEEAWRCEHLFIAALLTAGSPPSINGRTGSAWTGRFLVSQSDQRYFAIEVRCLLGLGNHPKPANDNHLKTGQR